MKTLKCLGENSGGHISDLIFLEIMINKKFLNTIEKNNMLNYGDNIIVAVSGGADSMFLLKNLLSLKCRFNLNLLVLHLNHGVRDTSVRDENFVINFCKDNEVLCKVRRVNMNQFAKNNGLSSEDAGRVLRYEFFRDESKKFGAKKIFLAHNANDQAETVIHRIIRGTGINGLAAMDYISDDLYRPMLDIKREEIENFLIENNISYCHDETNDTLLYTRNKIRLDLIPKITSEFNPNFIDALIRLSDIAKDNKNFISSLVIDYCNKNIKYDYLDTSDMCNSSDFFISEVIREFLNRKLSLLGVSKKHIETIVNSIKENKVYSVTLPKGKIIEFSYNKLYIKEEQKNFILDLRVGKNETPFGNIFIYYGKFSTESKFVIIDRDKIKNNLIIRTRQNGDRFMPLGMNNYKKLKDFFIDEKISRNLRDNTGIIVDGDEIVWVMPYRISQKYKTDKSTKNYLTIVWEEK